MKMAKNPKMCSTKTIPSTSGSLRASSVLKSIEKVATAMTNRVPCLISEFSQLVALLHITYHSSPSFWDISLVVEDYEPLDLSAGQVGN